MIKYRRTSTVVQRPEREEYMRGQPLHVQNSLKLSWSELAYISRPRAMI